MPVYWNTTGRLPTSIPRRALLTRFDRERQKPKAQPVILWPESYEAFEIGINARHGVITSPPKNSETELRRQDSKDRIEARIAINSSNLQSAHDKKSGEYQEWCDDKKSCDGKKSSHDKESNDETLVMAFRIAD